MSSATKLNLDVVWDLKFARLTGSNTNSETTNPETKNAQNNQISWQNSVILWAFDYYQQNWNPSGFRPKVVKYEEKNAYLKIDLLIVDHVVIPKNDC